MVQEERIITLQAVAAEMLDTLGRAVTRLVKLKADSIVSPDQPIGDAEVRKAWAEVVQSGDRCFSLSVYELARGVDCGCDVTIRNGALTQLCKARRALAIKARQVAERNVAGQDTDTIRWHHIIVAWHQVIEGPAEELALDNLVCLFDAETGGED